MLRQKKLLQQNKLEQARQVIDEAFTNLFGHELADFCNLPFFVLDTEAELNSVDFSCFTAFQMHSSDGKPRHRSWIKRIDQLSPDQLFQFLAFYDSDFNMATEKMKSFKLNISVQSLKCIWNTLWEEKLDSSSYCLTSARYSIVSYFSQKDDLKDEWPTMFTELFF